MESNDTAQLLSKHLATWSEPNAEKRKELIAEIYTDDIEIIDPFTVIRGQDNLGLFIENLLGKNHGFVFTATKPGDSHHDVARLSWQFGPADKPDAITGQDVFLISDEKINKLYAFID